MMRNAAKSVIEILLDPKALKGLVFWPKFSITSYRMLRELRNQIEHLKVIVDVGANVGQFSVAAANIYPAAKIYSFEPQAECYEKLVLNTKKFPRVSTYQLALGNEKSKRLLNVNEHSHSSSFLHTSDAHDLAFPDTKEIGEEEVNVEKLSNLIGEICLESPSLLKLDVQGFEMSVVAGAEAALDKIDYVILEASFREMYRGEKLFLQTVEEMRAYGFRFLRPVGFLKDPQTLEILQIDALFVRGS